MRLLGVSRASAAVGNLARASFYPPSMSDFAGGGAGEGFSCVVLRASVGACVGGKTQMERGRGSGDRWRSWIEVLRGSRGNNGDPRTRAADAASSSPLFCWTLTLTCFALLLAVSDFASRLPCTCLWLIRLCCLHKELCFLAAALEITTIHLFLSDWTQWEAFRKDLAHSACAHTCVLRCRQPPCLLSLSLQSDHKTHLATSRGSAPCNESRGLFFFFFSFFGG